MADLFLVSTNRQMNGMPMACIQTQPTHHTVFRTHPNEAISKASTTDTRS